MGKGIMRVIKNPHYINNARTVVACEFHYDDGRVLTANITNVDGRNPDWIEIHSSFSTEELERNTQSAIQRINTEKEQKALAEQAMADKQKQEMLYQMKLEAFEVPLVKDSTNKKLKAQIRKAKTPFEVNAFTSALILHEFNSQSTTIVSETAVG